MRTAIALLLAALAGHASAAMLRSEGYYLHKFEEVRSVGVHSGMRPSTLAWGRGWLAWSAPAEGKCWPGTAAAGRDGETE